MHVVTMVELSVLRNDGSVLLAVDDQRELQHRLDDNLDIEAQPVVRVAGGTETLLEQMLRNIAEINLQGGDGVHILTSLA